MQRAVPPIVRPASAQPVESPLAASNGVSLQISSHRLAEEYLHAHPPLGSPAAAPYDPLLLLQCCRSSDSLRPLRRVTSARPCSPGLSFARQLGGMDGYVCVVV